MNLEILEKIDSGAYADIYRAKNDLGREYAVKIIRKSAGDHTFARKQAEALSRVDSPRVVTIVGIEEVLHPDTGEPSSGIVMELVRGETLESLLRKASLDPDQARQIGTELCDGLREIHAAGVAHGDLHEGNVMVLGRSVKILDILYYDSLALISTQSREQRVGSDVWFLRSLLRKVLDKSKVSFVKVDEFVNATATTKDVATIASKFCDAFSESPGEHARQLEQAFGRVTDTHFVHGAPYASALADDILRDVYVPLLLRMIEKSATDKAHKDFVQIIWSRLTPDERSPIATSLAVQIDKEVPKGAWTPHLRLLNYIGRSGWELLPRVTSLRLENAIVTDVLSGRYSYHNINLHRGGELGTWARIFADAFQDIDRLVENIRTLLRRSWDEQNYIGQYFMSGLPRICRTEHHKKTIVDALRSAVANDAKAVVENLNKLPEAWRLEIAKKEPAG